MSTNNRAGWFKRGCTGFGVARRTTWFWLVSLFGGVVGWLIGSSLGAVAWVVGVSVVVWVVAALKYKAPKKSQTELLGAEQREHLLKRLTALRAENTSIDVLYSAPKDYPTYERLISIFRLANWHTPAANTRPLPLDNSSIYVGGTTVEGVNRHLVEGVAEALREAGFVDVRATVHESAIKETNPKFSYVQGSVKITVGHQHSS